MQVSNLSFGPLGDMLKPQRPQLPQPLSPFATAAEAHPSRCSRGQGSLEEQEGHAAAAVCAGSQVHAAAFTACPGVGSPCWDLGGPEGTRPYLIGDLASEGHPCSWKETHKLKSADLPREPDFPGVLGPQAAGVRAAIGHAGHVLSMCRHLAFREILSLQGPPNQVDIRQAVSCRPLECSLGLKLKLLLYSRDMLQGA